MSTQPYIPRSMPIVGKDGTVNPDWDRSFLQPLAQAVSNGTSHGTYANNAAALAGGLVVGQVYQTAAGELRIVV